MPRIVTGTLVGGEFRIEAIRSTGTVPIGHPKHHNRLFGRPLHIIYLLAVEAMSREKVQEQFDVDVIGLMEVARASAGIYAIYEAAWQPMRPKNLRL